MRRWRTAQSRLQEAVSSARPHVSEDGPRPTGRQRAACDIALRAVRILKTTIDQKYGLERAWNAEVKGLVPREQSLLRAICSGSLRYLAHYERALEYTAPKVADNPELKLLAVTTIYELEHMPNKASGQRIKQRLHDCCHALGHHWAVDAVSEACRMARVVPSKKDDMHTDASRLSLPGWLHSELLRTTPLKNYGGRLLHQPDFLGLNVDPARASPAEYVEQLATCGIDASVSNLSPHGVLVHSRPRDVGILPGISEGVVAVQDPAQQWALGSLSALPARACILDSCAAPGGKTRAVLHHQPSANVISLERSPSKVAKLRKRFEADLRVEVLEGDARKPAEWWNGVRFGAILLDAPCSATGIMRTRPEVKVHQTPASVNSLRATQFEMLRSLWPLLRDGGELLYTTCSLLSAENEDVIAKFVKQEKEAKMVKITPPLATDGKEYLSRKHGVLLIPSRWHQGGFSALLRKTCKQEPPTPPP